MKDDLENLGPRRREDVEAAQMKIVQTARKMIEEGKIVILGADTVLRRDFLAIKFLHKSCFLIRFTNIEKFFYQFRKYLFVKILWVVFF